MINVLTAATAVVQASGEGAEEMPSVLAVPIDELIIGIIAFLIILQPDLSTAASILATALSMFFIAGDSANGGGRAGAPAGRGGRGGPANGAGGARREHLVLWKPPYGAADTATLYQADGPIATVTFTDDGKQAFIGTSANGTGEIYHVDFATPGEKHTIVRQRAYTPAFAAGGGGGRGGVGGGVFRVGGGVSQPVIMYKVDPEYSEEARKAKYSGTVVLSVIVDTEGKASEIKVIKSLGMGLDEKAVEAVQKWKFKPGMKGGSAVNVRAQIEVNFRLL